MEQKEHNYKYFSQYVETMKPVPKDTENYSQSFYSDQAEEIQKFFWEYGFVVVRDVLSADEVNASLDDVWSIVHEKAENRIQRDSPKTWVDHNWTDTVFETKYNAKRGFLGFDQTNSQASWNNVQNVKFHAVFAAIFQQKNLWCKFDRYGFMRPVFFDVDGVKVSRPEWKTESNWIHWDQNPWLEPKFARIQSLFAISDHTETSGGFHCIPQFTKVFEQWADEHAKEKNESCLVDILPGDPIRKYISKVTMRPGSLLLWDSRTPHGNWPNEGNTFRVVQYTGMFPVPLWEESHCPEIFRFRKRRMEYALEDAKTPLQFTTLGKKIAGLIDYEPDEVDKERAKNPIFAKDSIYNPNQCGYGL